MRKQDKLKRIFSRFSGGRLSWAFPSDDSISRSISTYESLPRINTDTGFFVGEIELISGIRLKAIELGLTLGMVWRRSMDVRQSNPIFQQTARPSGTLVMGTLRVPRPLGGWDLVFGIGVGFLAGRVEYTELFEVFDPATGFSDLFGLEGIFSSSGLALEGSLAAEKYLSEKISFGPFLRYRYARLKRFRASAQGIEWTLADDNLGYFGVGPSLVVIPSALVGSIPGLHDAVLDFGGLSAGLELRYHY